MTCKKPLRTVEGYYVKCGQCMPCRVTRLTEITTRCYLEYRGNDSIGTFFTLTYAPEYLPKGGTLVKKDFQKFMKRFRDHADLKQIRFMGVGEYGERSMRPHYHGIIFGLPDCVVRPLLEKAWKFGFVQSRDLSGTEGMKSALNSINYTASYTLKKLTSEKDLPEGLEPEFWLASRKPAMGYSGLSELAGKLISLGLYPARALNIKQKFMLDRRGHKVSMQLWDGVFYLADSGVYSFPDTDAFTLLWSDPRERRVKFRHFFGRRLRLDDTMMRHLATLVDATLSVPEFAIDDAEAFRVYRERLQHKRMLDIIKREEAGEHEQIEKAAYKVEKRVRSSKAAGL